MADGSRQAVAQVEGIAAVMDSPHARRATVEAAIGALLLVAAFYGIATSDVSAGRSQAFWTGLVLAFAAAAVGAGWLHGGLIEGGRWGTAALRVALHWIGVLVAIELVYFYIGAGRLTNADAGLTNGLVLALGTFLAGVHGNWRLLVIGAALGIATAVVAYIEQYLWILFGVAILAIAVLVAGAVIVHRRRQGRPAA